jgi:hypothetical protein
MGFMNAQRKPINGQRFVSLSRQGHQKEGLADRNGQWSFRNRLQVIIDRHYSL